MSEDASADIFALENRFESGVGPNCAIIKIEDEVEVEDELGKNKGHTNVSVTQFRSVTN